MIYRYGGYDFVAEPETDFCMLEGCYYNGGNCFNCIDADSCPADLFSIEEIVEKGEVIC